MIAVDTNVLVYAHRREAREHAAAQILLRDLARDRAPWAIPWPCIYEFISVATNRKIWKDAASTPSQAWTQVEAWANSPSLRLLSEVDGFLGVLGDFAQRPRVTGPLIHDARVAALCIAHGVERLLSRDRDFALFPELRIENPFAPGR
jgi:toxin-antitoxin system PIN domain toxin